MNTFLTKSLITNSKTFKSEVISFKLDSRDKERTALKANSPIKEGKGLKKLVQISNRVSMHDESLNSSIAGNIKLLLASKILDGLISNNDAEFIYKHGIDAVFEERCFFDERGYASELAEDLAVSHLESEFTTKEMLELNYVVANYVPYGEREVIESYSYTNLGLSCAFKSMSQNNEWICLGNYYAHIAF